MNNTERETFLELLKKSNGISYNMITNNIAVGDYTSDYSDFDIIVNIDFPANNVKYNNILIGNTDENKKIYLVGMFDSPTENLTIYLDKLIPELMKETDKKYYSIVQLDI